MANLSSSKNNSSLPGLLKGGLWLGGGLLVLSLALIGALLAQSSLHTSLGGFVSWLFAANSVQIMWYITRSAGLISYLLLWLSVAWGLAVSSKILDTLLHRSFTYDFHQFISLLALGFIAVHLGSLMLDHYLPYTLPQILIPLLSPYRPVWVGVGVVAFYLTLLVTVTFYLRGRIGMKAFRTIHVFSLVSFLGVAVHGLMSGTDSSLPAVLGMYVGTFLSVVFLLVYWVITLMAKKAQKNAAQKVTAVHSAPVNANPAGRAVSNRTTARYR